MRTRAWWGVHITFVAAAKRDVCLQQRDQP